MPDSALAYVISDVHLGASPPDVEPKLRAFLRSLRGEAGRLIINGDLFDFWFEWARVIPRVGFRVLAELAELRDAGTEILWIAGNHDCWGGDVLRRDVGVEYHVGPWEGALGGWRTRIEHGDGLRVQEDRKYRAVRPLLRHPASVRLFRWLHPDVGSSLASGTADASRHMARARDGGMGLRDVAFGILRDRPEIDLVVFGHSHVSALERAPGGSVYANAGSWLFDPNFLRVTSERLEMRRWTGSAQGECLHALERRA